MKRKISRRFLQPRSSCLIVLQEPRNSIMKCFVEMREFEFAYEAQQLFIRRRFAELTVGSRGVELVIEAKRQSRRRADRRKEAHLVVAFIANGFHYCIGHLLDAHFFVFPNYNTLINKTTTKRALTPSDVPDKMTDSTSSYSRNIQINSLARSIE